MKKLEEIKDRIWIAAGSLLAVFYCVPFLWNGKGSVIAYHDQLDGELITYLLNAKYLLRGIHRYPEIMGGIPDSGMVSPAPAFILFYKILTPFAAFWVSMLLIKLCAFLSMYVLIRKLIGRKTVAFVCGIWFMALPFYVVYGLCIPGQPMLCIGLLGLMQGMEQRKRGRIAGYLMLIVLYAAGSSLALVGYACAAVIFFAAVLQWFRGRRLQTAALLLGDAVLGAVYLLLNRPLIMQLIPFSQGRIVSHKAEITVAAAPFLGTLRQILLSGDDYTQAQQIVAFPLILAACIIGIVSKKQGKIRQALKGLVLCLGMLLAIALWKGIYQASFFAELRNSSTGVLHDFNFGRFTWLMPTIWCMAAAWAAELLLARTEEAAENGKAGKGIKYLLGGLGSLFAYGTALCACLFALWQSDLKPNLVKILKGGEYYRMTWEQFYAEDLYREVDRLIGKPKDSYRVVSLGIYPAAASYNGFYCLDAYSNNYELSYKHEFRKILEPQLEKSDYLKQWYDGWGNRCYLVLAQYGNYFTFEKRWGPYTSDYEFRLDQLKDMGCSYLISAIYLTDWRGSGLKLLNPDEEPIQTDDSWYRLWVYEIE